MRSATKQKLGRDKKYLDYIRTLPCCVCALDSPQISPTEAAHVGPRGLGQKCPDNQTIPLCAEHHRLSQFSQHSMGRRFWDHYGLHLDTMLAMYQAHYQGESVLDVQEVCL